MQGAGIFSTLGGYVKGAGAHAASLLTGKYGMTAAGAAWGGMAGAGYGAMSDNTSIVGGAAMGAGLGAATARYGYAGYMGMKAGVSPHKVAYELMKMDARASAKGTIMMANKGLGRIQSTLKRWG